MAVNRAFIVLIVVAGCTGMVSAQESRGTTAPALSKIHKLEELTWPRIDALERRSDVVHPSRLE